MSEVVRRELEHYREVATALNGYYQEKRQSKLWWEYRFKLRELFQKRMAPTCPAQENIDRLLRYYRQVGMVAARYLHDRATPEEVREVLMRRQSNEAELAPRHSGYFSGKDFYHV